MIVIIVIVIVIVIAIVTVIAIVVVIVIIIIIIFIIIFIIIIIISNGNRTECSPIRSVIITSEKQNWMSAEHESNIFFTSNDLFTELDDMNYIFVK